MGFTKLDERILQSSIMAESAKTFKVWIALLASCKENGISPVSSIFLASACHLPLKDIDKALAILEAPDPRSRSLSDEGRRIQRVDGGYFVINYSKYRDYSYSDRQEAKRKREYRERLKEGQVGDTLGHVPKSMGHSASASASASSSVNKNLEVLGNTKIIVDAWNAFADNHGLTKIKAVVTGSTREKHLKARSAEKDFNFGILLDIIGRSPFLLGKAGKEPFFATFDWAICPSNFQKIIEGNYLSRKGGGGLSGIQDWLSSRGKS